MNAKFVHQVLKLRPDWRVTAQHFYRVPVQRVLCGFVYEKIPYSGAYLWHYAFPLFEPSQRLHLSYGDRLPEPDGSMSLQSRMTVEDEAAEFIRRIAPYEGSTYAWGDVSEFLHLLESKLESDSALYQRTHAMALVAVGRYEQAAAELRNVAIRPDIKEYSGLFRSEVECLIAALGRGQGHALEQLKIWENEARRRFGIES